MEELQSAGSKGPDIHLHSNVLKPVGDISGLILVIFSKQEHEKRIFLACLRKFFNEVRVTFSVALTSLLMSSKF
jgi:hypothetical protein